MLELMIFSLIMQVNCDCNKILSLHNGLLSFLSMHCIIISNQLKSHIFEVNRALCQCC